MSPIPPIDYAKLELGDEAFYRRKITTTSGAEREGYLRALTEWIASEKMMDMERARKAALNDKPRDAGIKPTLRDARSHKNSAIDAGKIAGKIGTPGIGTTMALDYLAEHPEIVEEFVPKVLHGVVFAVGNIGEIYWLIFFIFVLMFVVCYAIAMLDRSRRAY